MATTTERGLAFALSAAWALAPTSAHAQPLMAEVKETISAPSSGPQRALTVSTKGGKLAAGSCALAPCPLDREIAVPEAYRKGLSEARLDVIAIEQRRSVVRVVVPDSDAKRRWVALLAGPLTAAPPVELFTGEADPAGTPDAREPALVQVLEEGGVRQIVVGGRSDEVHLCGRPTPLGPRIIDPTDLTLKPARVQRLALAERQQATRVTAAAAGASPAPLARLLRAIGASSATHSPASLTDGDPESWWSENRNGDGRGEFVVMKAPREVPIASITITVRPPTRAVDDGASPQRFHLVDDRGVFEVTLPEDAWKSPGRAYQITFAEPRTTSCLGLVLGDAFGNDRKAAVTLAEVEARSTLDGKVTLDELVGRLDRGGDEARMASAMLVRGGADARKAIERGYGGLGDAGRLMALDAVDQGDCAEASPFFVRLLSSKLDQEARHARVRVERCGKQSIDALSAAVKQADHPSRLAAMTELALLNPQAAVPLLLRVEQGKDRKAVLKALSKAATAARGREALIAQLDDATLPPAATLDLMRAAGDTLRDAAVTRSASQALARVVTPQSGFEERYLALGPAGHLAAQGNEQALAFLGQALVDPTTPLRAAATAVAGPVAALRPRLLATASDPEPRVREALAMALNGQQGGPERGALAALIHDEWTFVRAAAYDALAQAGADGAVDQALLRRLGDDPSPLSKARLIEAIGRRGVGGAADPLRKLGGKKENPLDLRVRAVRALGAICHKASLDWLTELAQASADPMAEAETQAMGGAALVALGRLHPTDLAVRLGPLLARGAPRMASMAARAALDETSVCPR